MMHAGARSQVRVVTYNLLSPALSAPSSHLKCEDENLNPPERLKKIKNKILTQVIQKKAICCLQEVGMSWKADLFQLFDDNEYTVIDTHYGTANNDYMGLLIAYPFYIYKCHMSRCERLAESYIDYNSPDFFPEEPDRNVQKSSSNDPTKSTNSNLSDTASTCSGSSSARQGPSTSQKDATKASAADEGFTDKFKPKEPSQQVKDDFLKLIYSIKSWWKGEVKQDSAWEIAERRMNRVLMCRFHRVEDHEDIFAVANYHNPCLFGSVEKVQALALHTSMVVQSFEEFAGKNCPRIVVGDWNFTPTNSKIYEWMTTAREAVADEIGFMDGRPDRYKNFTPDFIPLDSAYALFNAKTREELLKKKAENEANLDLSDAKSPKVELSAWDMAEQDDQQAEKAELEQNLKNLEQDKTENPNFKNYEPRFTVFASGRTELEPDFMDTLDYIFLSKGHWDVVQTLPLPNGDEGRRGGVLPSRIEPSDHLMLAATLTCRKFKDYQRNW